MTFWIFLIFEVYIFEIKIKSLIILNRPIKIAKYISKIKKISKKINFR